MVASTVLGWPSPQTDIPLTLKLYSVPGTKFPTTKFVPSAASRSPVSKNDVLKSFRPVYFTLKNIIIIIIIIIIIMMMMMMIIIIIIIIITERNCN